MPGVVSALGLAKREPQERKKVTYGELTSAFHEVIDLIASELADENPYFFDIKRGTCKSIFLQKIRRGMGLALIRGWAKLMPGRCQELGQYTPTNPVPQRPSPPARAKRRHTSLLPPHPLPWLRGLGP